MSEIQLLASTFSTIVGLHRVPTAYDTRKIENGKTYQAF
jgi:hypothetical protein